MSVSGRSGFLGQVNRLTVRHLCWIERTTRRAPRLLIAIFLFMVLLSFCALRTIRFDTDIFHLFPAHRPAMGLMLDSLTWSGGSRDAYFLLEGDPALLPIEAARLAGRLRALQVAGGPAFKRVTYRIYEQSEERRFIDLVGFAASHPAAFVPPEQMVPLAARFTPQGIDQALGRLTAQLAGAFGGSGVRLTVADPLGVRELFLPRLKRGSQALNLDTTSPYFLSRDGRVLIMIAEPVRPVDDMAFARSLVNGINRARQGLKVKVSCAGAHISAVLDEAAMKANILSCVLSSLFVVLGIFYGVYRRLLPTLMIPLILGIGVLFALGTAALFLTGIHIISFAFMALIIGLGTDYSIHLYDRFQTERTAGATTDEAIQMAVVDTGQGLFTAAMTTALPFLALGWSEVRALSELGILVGLGVIYSLYATLLLMPILLRATDGPARYYRPLPALGMGRLWRFTGQRPRLLFWIAAGVLLLGALSAIGISFDGELKNLQPRHSEAFKAQELVERHLNLAPRSLLVALDAPRQDEALRHSRPVEALAERLTARGELQAWSGIGQAINGETIQRHLIERLRRIKKPAATIAEKLAVRGFAIAPFTPYLTMLQAGSLTTPVPSTTLIHRLAASPLRGVVDRHLVQDHSGWHALTYLYYRPGQLHLRAFLQQLHRVAPEARVTGTDLISAELLAAVRHSAILGVSLGGGLVLLLLLVHFRNFAGITASLGPVLLGTVAMVGAMALLGMRLNFMNIMVLVTIIGMGSDYGLHIQHRCSATDPARQEAAFIQSGRSVLLSALTTIAGFGSLAFTDYGAMSSIGWATNLGIGFTAAAALALVPALLQQRAIGR